MLHGPLMCLRAGGARLRQLERHGGARDSAASPALDAWPPVPARLADVSSSLKTAVAHLGFCLGSGLLGHHSYHRPQPGTAA